MIVYVFTCIWFICIACTKSFASYNCNRHLRFINYNSHLLCSLESTFSLHVYRIPPPLLHAMEGRVLTP